MPLIPRYSATEVPGVSQARQNIQSSPNTFGAAQGRALQDVSSGMDAITARLEAMQAEADEVAATEAYVAASDALRTRMRGENGFLTLQGESAEEGYNALLKDAGAVRDQYGANLSPNARRAFDAQIASRYESVANQGATHVFNQRQARQEAAVSAEITDRRNNAIENHGDPVLMGVELQAGADATRRRGRALGLDDDTINTAVDGWRSETILLAVNAAIDTGDTAGGQALLERYSGDDGMLVGADRVNAEALVRTATARTRAQADIEGIYARFGSDERSALRYIRENYEGEEEDLLSSRYSRRVAADEASTEAVVSGLIARATEVVNKGGSIYDMSPSEFGAIPSDVREYFLRRERGEPASTNYEAFSAFMQASPQELRDTPLGEIRAVLADPEFNQVMARRNDTMSPGEYTRIQTITATVDGVIGAREITDAQAPAFLGAIQERVRAEEEARGRPLTPTEVEDVANSYAARTVFELPGAGIFGTTRRTVVRAGVPGVGGTVLEGVPGVGGTVPEGVPTAHRGAVEAAFSGNTVDESVAIETYGRAVAFLTEHDVPVNSYTIEDRVKFEYLMELERLGEAAQNANRTE